ncbi:hypothetical protein NHX12_031916 [Muraenolepis orangiensis]|uniref:Uncharacterized protein n=1 Tax=Muraenolepis orangiensis TaxID=630683 RepID=A0A9Q0IK47_9TELE|nr:hypothetical protein NHX12_031916 [Muraenolepis orangiensis]
MTGLTLQGGVRPQLSTLGRLGIPVRGYSALGALGARGYGAKMGKVAAGVGLGAGMGMGMPLGAGFGNGMGLHHAGKRGVLGNGYGTQPGYGPVAGVGYAGVRPGWPAAYLGGFGRAGGGQGVQNVRGTLMGKQGHEASQGATGLRTLAHQAPKIKGHTHVRGAAAPHLHGGVGGGGGGGLWHYTLPPGEQAKSLDPAGKMSHGPRGPLSRQGLGWAVTPGQAGNDLASRKRAFLASRGADGGAGHRRHHPLPFSIEGTQGLVLPVPPAAQGSSGSWPLPHPGTRNLGHHHGPRNPELVAAAAAGSQVLVNQDGQNQRPVPPPLGQGHPNYGSSFHNSHSSSGYFGVAFEHGHRETAVTDKEAVEAQSAATGERAGLLGLLTPGAPEEQGPGAGGPVGEDPGSRRSSVDSAAGRGDGGLVAGGGQVTNGFLHVDPVLTPAPPGPNEKRKQGPYMGYGVGSYPGAALGVAGYGAGAGNLGHGIYPQGGKMDFGVDSGVYGAAGLGNGYGYGNGYNMGANGYGHGGAGSVPLGGAYGADAQAMGLGMDSGLGGTIRTLVVLSVPAEWELGVPPGKYGVNGLLGNGFKGV